MAPKNFLVRFPPWKSIPELIDFPAFDLESEGITIKIMEWDGDDVPLAELPVVWVHVKGIPPKNSAWKSFTAVITSCGILMDVDWGSFFKSFYAEIRVQIACRDPVKIPKEVVMVFEQKMYLLKFDVEGVEQIEDGDGFDDQVANEGFDELEDLNESNQLMDTGREFPQTTVTQGVAGNYKTCTNIPEGREDLELSNDRFVFLPRCKSWHGDEPVDEWECDTPMSHKSLPSRMDYEKMDLDVWEFEPQPIVAINEEALSHFEKSANAAYCSEVLSSFNLDDTDEDMSDCASIDGKVDDEMDFLPQDLVDRLGSVRKNLFPILEQSDIVSVNRDMKNHVAAVERGKPSWGPTVATSRMTTRNQGHGNMIEKAKEYQKRKNLEIPPAFKDEYYTNFGRSGISK
ncbi:hypothetical protein ACQ4PT_046084 [Festuca glaucescens]